MAAAVDHAAPGGECVGEAPSWPGTTRWPSATPSTLHKRSGRRSRRTGGHVGTTELNDAEVYVMIDALGYRRPAPACSAGQPEQALPGLGLSVSYRHTDGDGLATVSLVVADECVRGGSCTLTTPVAGLTSTDRSFRVRCLNLDPQMTALESGVCHGSARRCEVPMAALCGIFHTVAAPVR